MFIKYILLACASVIGRQGRGVRHIRLLLEAAVASGGRVVSAGWLNSCMFLIKVTSFFIETMNSITFQKNLGLINFLLIVEFLWFCESNKTYINCLWIEKVLKQTRFFIERFTYYWDLYHQVQFFGWVSMMYFI